MFLATGLALALIPLGVYAYRDLSMRFDVSEKEELPDKVHQGWRVPIGLTQSREEYTLDFSKTPHLVLGGATRYGKSTMIHSLVVSLMRSRPDDVTFTMIDLKGGIELGNYKKLKNCLGVAMEPDEALRELKSVYSMMKATQQRLRASNKKKHLSSKHFIIIDEVGELNPSEAVDREEKKLKLECQRIMSQISRLGAGLGYHLILATQYPTGDVIPRQCKQNSDAKICFRVQSGVASKVVLDETGAEELPDIKGRAIFQRGANRYVVQTYLVSEKHIENTIKTHRREQHGDTIIEVESIEQSSGEDTFIFEETQFSDEDATF
ncbi:hypothetical protein BC6_00080 [Bacillus phage BC-6]|nr:hypothetical protein BC6_00080 [Bacillus phage BC-6]